MKKEFRSQRAVVIIEKMMADLLLFTSRMGLCSDSSSSFPFVKNQRLFFILFVISTFCLSVFTFAAENKRFFIKDVLALRSSSGRYTVVSTNSYWNASLMRWLETVDAKVERIIGLKMSFDSRLIRIVVSGEQSGTSDVVWSQGYDQGRFIQQLRIYDYMQSDISRAEVVLCGLFLNGYIVNRQPDVEASCRNIAQVRLRAVPSWLALGIAKNLYSSYRAANSTELLAMYDSGKLPSVKEMLKQFSDPKQVNELNGSVCGMFVLWLSKQIEHEFLFDKLFSIIATGKSVTPEDLSLMIKGSNSVDDLEKIWIDWLVKQRRMIYTPGVVTEDIIDKLKEMLSVTPLESRNAGGPILGGVLHFNELISLRKESWVIACARQKIIHLKLMFVGRGDDISNVVDLYCRFLSSLEKHKRKKILRKLLNEADDAMMSLSEKYGGEK